jgi:uncharacterized protein
VTPSDQVGPVQFVGAASQVAFCIAGIVLLFWLPLSGRGREKMRVRLPEWRIGATDFACFLCCGFVGCAAATSVIGFVLRRAHLGPDAATLLSPVAVDGGFLLGLAGFYRLYAGREEAVRGPADIPYALRTGLATFLVATPLLYLALWASEVCLTRFGFPVEKQAVVDMFEAMRSAPLKVCFVALAATLVPAAEEIIFRAGLFRYFRTRMPRWAAILGTSLLFGAAHVGWGEHMSGLVSALPLVVLAAVYCLAYERTGAIGTTIVAHALFNLNMTILILIGVGS